MISFQRLKSLYAIKCTRNLWEWVNITFNTLDEDRLKRYGPDRTCAEWLLRNGAALKWTTAPDFLRDYNGLPPEGAVFFIEEIDATASSISHHGFCHLNGCKHIKKIILHKCCYLTDEALPLLKPVSSTLKYLQISSCGDFTENGLKKLELLKNLDHLLIFGMPYLTHKEDVLKHLAQHLPNCKIDFQ